MAVPRESADTEDFDKTHPKRGSEGLLRPRGRIIIALAVVRLCLAGFGCVANVVAAVVLTNRKLWSPTSMLLLSLVIYDAVYLLLVLPVGATSISVNVHFSAARMSTLRTIVALCFPLRNMAQMGSTYTTLTVTLERFLVIFLPLRASSMWTYGKTRRAIVGVLLFSVLFNLPRCFDHILSKPRASRPPSGAEDLPSVMNTSSDSPPSSVSQSGGLLGQRDRDPAYMGLVSAMGNPGTDVTRTGNANCANISTGLGLMTAVDQASLEESWDSTNQKSPSVKSSTETQPEVGASWGEEDEEGVSESVVYFYKVVYQFYLTVIFLYLIPYTLIPVLNLQLVIALRRRRDECRRLSVKNEHRLNWTRCRLTMSSKMDKEEGLTYIVFGITLCYFICCILPAVYMVAAIASHDTTSFPAVLIFNAGETTLVVNAATDFFFYCLLGRKFRRVFMRMFCARHYIHKANSFSMKTTISYNSIHVVDLTPLNACRSAEDTSGQEALFSHPRSFQWCQSLQLFLGAACPDVLIMALSGRLDFKQQAEKLANDVQVVNSSKTPCKDNYNSPKERIVVHTVVDVLNTVDGQKRWTPDDIVRAHRTGQARQGQPRPMIEKSVSDSFSQGRDSPPLDSEKVVTKAGDMWQNSPCGVSGEPSPSSPPSRACARANQDQRQRDDSGGGGDGASLSDVGALQSLVDLVMKRLALDLVVSRV
ncbi:uncharacterized protein LOC143300792 [Babylonia areolata]|uniref:uncharacterized protein LOC143300792 n=1 Tax=Babylonia areolata TaxID=304850 RepID=UPI003FCF1BBF